MWGSPAVWHRGALPSQLPNPASFSSFPTRPPPECCLSQSATPSQSINSKATRLICAPLPPFTTLRQGASQAKPPPRPAPSPAMSTAARRRLMRDLKRLQSDPPQGVQGAPLDNNVRVGGKGLR